MAIVSECIEGLVDTKFYEKPILWDSHFPKVIDERLVSVKTPTDLTETERKIQEIDIEHFANALQSLETRQLNLLRYNLIHLSSHFQQLSLPLSQMIQTVEQVINRQLGYIPCFIPMTKPRAQKIQEYSPIFQIYRQVGCFYEAMSPDYYTFLHGQSTRFLPYYYFLKEVFRQIHPELSLHNFKVMRTKKMRYSTIDEYHRAIDLRSDHEKDLSVFCASAHTDSEEPGESAFYFLLRNANAGVFAPYCYEDDLKEFLELFVQDPEKKQRILKIIIDYAEKIGYNCHDLGNLMIMCIPKDFACKISDPPLWFCRPFSLPFKEVESRRLILDRFQRGDVEGARSQIREAAAPKMIEQLHEIIRKIDADDYSYRDDIYKLSDSIKREIWSSMYNKIAIKEKIQKILSEGSQIEGAAAIQVRLLVNEMTVQNGVKIFSFNVVDPQIKRECKIQMRLLAEEIIQERKRAASEYREIYTI